MDRAPSQRLLPGGLAWLFVFAAVLAHLPELRGWFAQDDFDSLARATGSMPSADLLIRPFSTVWSWKLLHAFFGLEAVAYHAVALLAFAGLVLWTLRVAARLGLGRVAMATAGLWTVATPFALRPISWASASGEIWAALFALMALDLWALPASSRRPWPLAAAALALLSLASKESGLVLPLLLLLAQKAWPARDAPQARRARRLALAGILLASAITAWTVARHFAGGELGAYALDLAKIPRNLARAAIWYLSPFAGHPPEVRGWMQVAGLVFWALWALDAWRRSRQGEHATSFSLLLTLGSLAPVLGLATHFESYYLLLGGCGVGWWLGMWVERCLPKTFDNARVLVVLLLVVVGACSWRSQTTMSARLPDGRLADPILRRESIALQTRRQLQSIPTLDTTPMVAVLQATRVDFDADPDETVLLATPVVQALHGEVGLRVLLPEGVDGRWVPHLDGLPLDTLVLLDVGDEHLRILGPPENARLYSALIAVSAGQFPRARHDLWKVLGRVGDQIRFAFDADNLPIRPDDLDAEAEPFVRFLEAENQPSSGQILHLFAQLYEAVRGQPLLEDWLSPKRAPREGD